MPGREDSLTTRNPRLNQTYAPGGHTLAKSITAHVGQIQGGSPTTKRVNEISVCANAGDSVTAIEIPDGNYSYEQIFINNGAQRAALFPFLGQDLGAGVNASIPIMPNGITRITSYSATEWKVG